MNEIDKEDDYECMYDHIVTFRKLLKEKCIIFPGNDVKG